MEPDVLGIKLYRELFEKKKGNVFRRGIVLRKEGQFVQILVIDFLQGLFGCRFHFAEINQYAVSLQGFPPQNYFNLPVMSVEIFALPSKVPQIMSRSKVADYLYFKKPLVQKPISPPMMMRLT